MGTLRTWHLIAYIISLAILRIEGRFINFKPGYEYVYSFNGHSTVNDIGKFVVQAKVRYAFMFFLIYINLFYFIFVIQSMVYYIQYF
jgi:hypothetical protein